MKRWALIGLMVLVLTGGAVFFIFKSPSHSVEDADGPLSVDIVGEHPERYSSSVSVKGVVYHVSAEENTAVLISEEEFAMCGTSCPEILLPVHWNGILPEIADRVLLRGKVVKNDAGFLFEAEGVIITAKGKTDE